MKVIFTSMGLRLRANQLLGFKVISQQFRLSKENNSKSSYRNYICFETNHIWFPSQRKLSFHCCTEHLIQFLCILSQGLAYILACLALRYFFWQGFVNKNGKYSSQRSQL